MASYSTIQQIQDLVTFPFRDPHWKRKLGIAYFLILLSYTILLIPLYIFLDGYIYRIMKRMISENGEPYLPEWDDWKGLFKDGLRLFIPRFIITLPIILVFSIIFGAIMMGTYKLSLNVPNDPIISVTQPVIPIIFIVLFLIFFGGTFLYIFVLGFINPVLMSHIVATDQMTAIFRVREWWKIYKANFPGFILAFFIPMIIAPILSIPINLLSFTFFLSFLIPFILPLITLLVYIVSNSMSAQAYAKGLQLLAKE